MRGREVRDGGHATTFPRFTHGSRTDATARPEWTHGGAVFPDWLVRLALTGWGPICHSERSEESLLSLQRGLSARTSRIPRLPARDDDVPDLPEHPARAHQCEAEEVEPWPLVGQPRRGVVFGKADPPNGVPRARLDQHVPLEALRRTSDDPVTCRRRARADPSERRWHRSPTRPSRRVGRPGSESPDGTRVAGRCCRRERRTRGASRGPGPPSGPPPAT